MSRPLSSKARWAMLCALTGLAACGGGQSPESAGTAAATLARAQALAAPASAADAAAARARPDLTVGLSRRGVSSMAVSADGRALALVSLDDGEIRMLDPVSGRLTASWPLLRQTPPAGLVFTRDSKTLVAVGRNSEVQGWSATTGRPSFTLQGHAQGLRCVATSADGRWVATAGDEGRVLIWDLTTARLQRVIAGLPGSVNAISLSVNGARVAVGGIDPLVLVYDTTSGVLVQALHGHDGPVRALDFSRDGRWLASAGQDAQVLLRPIGAGLMAGTAVSLTGHSAPVRTLAFSADGSTLASGGDGGEVLVWDLATLARLRELAGGGSPVNTLAFGAVGRRQLYVGTEDNRLQAWDVDVGTARGVQP